MRRSYETVRDIANMGRKGIEKKTVSSCSLLYSSPATLQYNSPGAYGFGVKRAGLLLPESVMLLVAPGCCGRNSAIVGSKAGYGERMFYLKMDETDQVTGRHLNKIPKAISEICESVNPRPKAVLICITCVDALLGTDLERVSRKAEEECGIHVVPCYMYAITREGKKPPMVAIRQALYSLLEPVENKEKIVNLLGNFAPLNSGCEFPVLLREAGFDRVMEISACRGFDEYMQMGGARLNIVLNPESNPAAEDLRKRLGTPYCELARLYQIDKIKKQYALFGAALGTKLDDHIYYEKASAALDDFILHHKGLHIAVGQMLNANSFELSLSLVKYGMSVPLIFANYNEGDYPYLKALCEISPDTRVYSSLSPSMLSSMPDFEHDFKDIGLTIGMDAGYYLPATTNVPWNEERQPFGYQGLTKFIHKMEEALTKEQNNHAGMFGAEGKVCL